MLFVMLLIDCVPMANRHRYANRTYLHLYRQWKFAQSSSSASSIAKSTEHYELDTSNIVSPEAVYTSSFFLLMRTTGMLRAALDVLEELDGFI